MKTALIAAAAMLLGIGVAAAGTDHPNSDKTPPGFSEGNKTGWDKGKEPPGWDKGLKQGWNDEDSPPGLEDKDYKK